MTYLVRLAIVLLVLFPLGLGFYALLAGQFYLIIGSIRGPLARVIGLGLILSTIMCLPVLLRVLVGMAMNLGH